MGTLAVGVIVQCVVSGCGAHPKRACPGAQDVCLYLPLQPDEGRFFQCAYRGAMQVIRYYHPDPPEQEINTKALVFEDAHDTVSILFFLRDNVAGPVELDRGSIAMMFDRLNAGHPCIVFVPVDTFAPRSAFVIDKYVYHCLVIAGYNSRKTELFCYSDGEGPYVIDRSVFEEKWRRVGNLWIVVKGEHDSPLEDRAKLSE